MWRSLVARRLWVAEVPGSNPGTPISGIKFLALSCARFFEVTDRNLKGSAAAGGVEILEVSEVPGASSYPLHCPQIVA